MHYNFGYKLDEIRSILVLYSLLHLYCKFTIVCTNVLYTIRTVYEYLYIQLYTLYIRTRRVACIEAWELRLYTYYKCHQ